MHPLPRAPVCACASPAYLEARGTPKHPKGLEGHDTIGFAPQGGHAGWHISVAGKPLAYRPQSRFQANTGDVAIEAALEGLGITRVLSYQVAAHVASGALSLVLEDFMPPPVPVHVVHKETGHVSARVRAAVDILVECLRRHIERKIPVQAFQAGIKLPEARKEESTTEKPTENQHAAAET